MNYRHAFHAGSFADVHKHAVLARVLRHLCEKPTAFRVIDTHAGAGRYDLTGPEASRSNEWRNGIARVFCHTFATEPAALLAPYLKTLASFNPTGALETYPGSPLICRALMRPQDRLIACELEPGAAAALQVTIGRGRRAKTVTIDGWTALRAYVPPPERRGLVLVDPAYEVADEFERLADALAAAQRKWPTGVFLCWYPIKDRAGPDRLARELVTARIPKVLRAEISSAESSPARLRGSGLIVVNPPWQLANELAVLQPALAAALGLDQAPPPRLDWLSEG